MISQFSGLIIAFISITIILLALPTDTLASPPSSHESSGSAFDLVNAVNNLRVSNGLAAYSISSILMYTAQNQADFMAANGIVTHSGPGGIGLTDRLLAAGYPLAGDLTLGGFRAENITSGSESMSPQSAVERWAGDALHLNTMLSPDLTEIGAGVSMANGRVYYVIDAALPTTGGASQGEPPVPGGVSAIPGNEAPIPVVMVNTPNRGGDIIHEVQSGQTLWQIAIAYNVKIDDIKRMNNLFDNNIYPGEKLLIANITEVTKTTTFTPASTEIAVSASAYIPVPTTVQVTTTSTRMATSGTHSSNSTVMMILIGIITLAIFGGSLFTWFGNTKRE